MAKSDLINDKDDAWIAAEIAKNFDSAKARGDRDLAKNPQATKAWYVSKEKRVHISLTNGIEFSFPTELAQGLRGASDEGLSTIELLPFGTGLHWPLIDADLSVTGLLAGVFGSKLWMKEIASIGGKATSKAKTDAARANGLKGGRPKKTTTDNHPLSLRDIPPALQGST